MMAPHRIYIVEDNRIIAEEYKTNLFSLGYEVSGIASSGDEALNQIEKSFPDLVLMDVKLKGKMDGIEAANKIQTLFNIPVVYVTAYADEATLERIKKSQPYGFIYKPFDYNELHAVIENALYKHQMEKKLKESEKWLSTTLRSIGDAVIATDRNGNVTFVNPVAEELTGWKENEAKGKSLKQIFKIVNEITGKPAENPVERVLREGIVVGLANHSVLINRKGKEIPIADSGAPIKDDRGKIIGVVLVFRDVTEKRMTERIRAQLAAIVESSDDAIIGQTLDGKIISWNKGAEKIYGYEAKEVIGRSISILVPPDFSDDFTKIIERIKQGKHIVRYETKQMKKDGKNIDVSLTVSPIKDPIGKLVGVSTIARDVTERKEAEAKIVHLNEVLQAIREVNQLITREKSEEKLLNRACKILAEIKKYDCVAIFYNNKSYKAGNEPGLERLEEIFSKEKETINRIRKINSRKVNGKYLSVSPIRKDEVKAFLYVVHLKPLDEEELSLLKEISSDIGFALHNIKLENERKQMEENLRIERDRAQKYLNVAGIMFIVVGKDYKISMINRKGCEILECEEKDCVGKNWFDNFIPRKHRDEVKAIFEKLMAGEAGPTEYFENSVLTAKGNERIIAWHNTVLKDKLGNIIGTLSSGEDITERRQTQEALKESEKFLSNVLESIQDGISVLNPDLTIRRVNGVMNRWYKENIPLEGKKCYECYHNRTEPCDPCPTLRCMKSGKTERDIVPGLPGSPVKWVELFSYPVKSPDTGRVTSVVEFVRDITKRKETEDTLKESEKRYRTFINSAPYGIVVHDKNGKFLIFNSQMKKITGYSREELPDLDTWFRKIYPDDEYRAVVIKEHKKIVSEKSIRSKEAVITRKDGEKRTCRFVSRFLESSGLRMVFIEDVTDRKQIEEKLKESEERFRGLFENAVLGLYRTTPSGEILLANPALVKMLGYSSFEELRQRNLEKDGFHPDYPRSEFKRKIEKKGTIIGMESIWTRKDGSKLYIRESARVVRNSSGKVLYYDGTVEDITEQKLAEKSLKESEERFRTAFNSSIIGKVVTRLDGYLQMVNDSFCRMLGYTKKEMLTKSISDVTHPDDVEKSRINVEKLIEGKMKGDTFTLVKRYVRKDGSIIFGKVYVSLVRDDQRKPLYMIAEIEDITERKHTEEALQQSEERMRLLVEGTPHLFFYTQDVDGNVTYVSPSVEKITGYKVEQWVGQSHWFITDSPINQKAKERTRAHLRGEFTRGRILLEVKHTDGHPILLEIYENPILRNGKVVGLQGVAHDITEQKRAEEALRESEEKYRNLVEQSPDAIFTVDRENNFLSVNKTVCDKLGYTREELLKMNLWDVLPESYRDQFRERISKILYGEALDVPAEYEAICKTGVKLFVEVRSAPIIKAGEIVGFQGIARDITERKKSEQALKESEEKYRAIVEQTHDAIYIYRDDRFLFVNDTVSKITGYSKEELYKLNIWDLVHPDEREKLKEIGKKRARGEKVPSRYEARIVTKTGEVRDCEFSVDRIFYQGKYAALGAVRDITERKKIEKIRIAIYKISEAAMLAERLDNLFHSIHSILGDLISVKNFYVALYDADSNRLSFPYFVDQYDKKPTSHKPSKGLTEYVLRTGQPLLATPEVLEKLVKDGEVKPVGAPCVDWLGVPLKTKERTIGVLVVQSYSEDVRFGEEEKAILTFVSNQVALAIDRKQAEERIQRDLEERGILLREIHHRVKNNLQVIKSLLSLQSAYVKDKDDLEMFRESQNRIQSMALVHEKLYQSPDLARIEFGRYIEDISRALYRSYGIDPSKIKLDVKVDDIRIGIDFAVPCGLIINELVSNALKYAFPPSWSGEGKIDVIIRLIGKDEIELTVRDNGIGFPKELDFRKTESLGLHLVHILAEEQLGGEIKLERTKGTEFQMRFRIKER